MKQTFDFDLVVIGGGSGGVRAARFAANYGARVALIERQQLGGTCVNRGCIPKKLMVTAGQFSDEFQLAQHYGWSFKPPRFDWPTFRQQQDSYLTFLNSVYDKLLTSAKVTVFNGTAEFSHSHEIKITSPAGGCHSISTAHTLITTGSTPSKPDIPGAELAITSDQFFTLKEQPKRCIVIGGGYIAVELASLLNKLGTKVHLIVRSEGLLKKFDTDITNRLTEALAQDGVKIRFNSEITKIEKFGEALKVYGLSEEIEPVDCVIMATGRHALVDPLKLENTRVSLNARGLIDIDAHFQTQDEAISALGDVVGNLPLTPIALHEAMVFAKARYNNENFTPIDYAHTATAIFTTPEIAVLGLTEQQAREQYAVDVYESEFRDLHHAFDRKSHKTYLKVIVDKTTDKLLGIHLLGTNVSEIIQGFSVAMNLGARKQDLDRTVGIHPSIAEELLTLRTPRQESPEDKKV